MSRELAISLFALGGTVILFYWIERARLSTKELALIASLAGLAALGRIPFAVLPSAQPTTFFVIVSGFVFGPVVGCAVGAVAALASNIVLGHGPWTFFQVIAWGLCGASAGIFGKFVSTPNRTLLIVFGVVWGFVFGWLMNTWYWVSFIYPLSFESWLYTNATSLWFDVVHAVTNGLLLGIFGHEVIAILRRFRGKLSYTLQRAA